MHLTIVKNDNVVAVDGVAKEIDLSNIQPPNFWALQWDGPTDGIGGEGEIEYSGKPPTNEEITDLGPYYVYYEEWLAAPLPPPPFSQFSNL